MELVGRERELERLLSALGEGGPLVTFLHGPPGVGKSALLAAFAARAPERGTQIAMIDCRDVEPTPRALLDGLGHVLGSDLDGLGQLSTAIAFRGAQVVIALDTYECFRLVDSWVRDELVGALPAGCTLVLAGRDAPLPDWSLSLSTPASFVQLALGRLADADAIAFLRSAGVSPAAAHRLGRLARGHPLTLRLAAAAALARGEPDIDEQAAPAVFEALTRLYVTDLPSATQRALDAASVVRRITLPLLAAMLTEVDAQHTFENLANLPFVEAARDGLVLHDALQQAIAGRLRAADPERYRDHRTAAWRQLRREARAITSEEHWRYTADMLYLIENPVVREAFFPASLQRVSVAPAREADATAMRAVAKAHATAAEARLLGSWLELAGNAGRVARAPTGVCGFAIVTTFTEIPANVRHTDPVVRAWREHLQANPLTPGEIVLVLRRWLDSGCGEAPSPTQAALWLDCKRTYMELRPALRRLYTVLRDPEPYLPVMLELGFALLDPIKVGADMFHPACLDFGPGSVDGWLAGLAARELGVDDTNLFDPQERELLIEGRRVALTRIEVALVELLLTRAGTVVSRQEILRTAWQTDHEGSNVIEAAVGSLRRKLGPESHRLETVRGVGYRMRGT